MNSGDSERDAVKHLARVHHEYDRQRFIPPTKHIEQGYGGFLAEQTGEPESIVLVAERDGCSRGRGFGRRWWR